MIINCDYCGTEFNRKPSAMKDKNFCSKICRHDNSYAMCTCDNCGKKFERHRSQILDNVFCSRECAKPFLSKNMTVRNIVLNPDRMTLENRSKVRKGHLARNANSGNSYPKLFGRHEHRVVAEQMLGRPLKKGEVVHHIDNDKTNNHPLNLMVFASQAEHARYHYNEIHNPQLNFE